MLINDITKTPKSGYIRLNWTSGSLKALNSGGVNALIPREIVTSLVPVTTDTITGAPFVNETHDLTPAGTLAALTWLLPDGNNACIGQIKRFHSSAITTALTVTVSGSGTKRGAALTAGAANTVYAYQCVAITAGVATWLRLQ